MDREQLEGLWDQVARGPADHFGVGPVLDSIAEYCDDNERWAPSEIADMLRAVATDLGKLADALQ